MLSKRAFRHCRNVVHNDDSFNRMRLKGIALMHRIIFHLSSVSRGEPALNKNMGIKCGLRGRRDASS